MLPILQLSLELPEPATEELEQLLADELVRETSQAQGVGDVF